MHATQSNENNSVTNHEESTETDEYRMLNNVNPSVAGNVATNQSMTTWQKLLRMTYIPLVPLILGLCAFVSAFYYVQSETIQLFVAISSGFVGITGTVLLILAKIDISGDKSSELRSDLSAQID